MDPSLLANPQLLTSAPTPPSDTRSSPSPVTPPGTAGHSLQANALSPSGLSGVFDHLSVQALSRNPSSSLSPQPPSIMNPSNIPPAPRTSPAYNEYNATAHHTTQPAGAWGKNFNVPGANGLQAGYHGNAQYADDGDDDVNNGADMELDDDATPGVGRSGAGAAKGQNFVKKLWNILADPTASAYIQWTSDGTGFIIPNNADFAQHVLGRVFKHNNFQSFVRQLNMYDFHKINRAPRAQRGAQESHHWHFRHDMFLRDKPQLLSQIKRKAADTTATHNANGYFPQQAEVLSPVVEMDRKGSIASQDGNLQQQVHQLTERTASLEKEIQELRAFLNRVFPQGVLDARSLTPQASGGYSGYGDAQPIVAHPPSTYPANMQSGGLAAAHSAYTAPTALNNNAYSQHSTRSDSSASISPASEDPSQVPYSIMPQQIPDYSNSSVQGFSSAVASSYQQGFRSRTQAQVYGGSSGHPSGSASGMRPTVQIPNSTGLVQNIASSSTHLQVPTSTYTGNQQTFSSGRSDQSSLSRAPTPTQNSHMAMRVPQDGQGNGSSRGGRSWPVAILPPSSHLHPNSQSQTQSNANASFFPSITGLFGGR